MYSSWVIGWFCFFKGSFPLKIIFQKETKCVCIYYFNSTWSVYFKLFKFIYNGSWVFQSKTIVNIIDQILFGLIIAFDNKMLKYIDMQMCSKLLMNSNIKIQFHVYNCTCYFRLLYKTAIIWQCNQYIKLI